MASSFSQQELGAMQYYGPGWLWRRGEPGKLVSVCPDTGEDVLQVRDTSFYWWISGQGPVLS